MASQCLRTDVPVFGFKDPAGSEKHEQMLLFGEIGRWQTANPILGFIFHTPNGEKRSRKTANDLQKMGVKPGVWDVIYPARPPVVNPTYKVWNGLAIEMKVGYGKLEPAQVEWMDFYQYYGWYTAVCYSWLWAWRVVSSYFNLTVWDWKEGVSIEQRIILPYFPLGNV
jgi:hypothetical protein